MTINKLNNLTYLAYLEVLSTLKLGCIIYLFLLSFFYEGFAHTSWSTVLAAINEASASRKNIIMQKQALLWVRTRVDRSSRTNKQTINLDIITGFVLYFEHCSSLSFLRGTLVFGNINTKRTQKVWFSRLIKSEYSCSGPWRIKQILWVN